MKARPSPRSVDLQRFPRVYPILDSGSLGARGVSAVRLARSLAEAGVRIAQFRHKGPFTRAAYEQAARVAAVFRASGTCFVVNDRADIALALGADGVHVGQEDLPPDVVRGLVGPAMLLGYSTHNAGQLVAQECRWADYLAIGPAFGTSTKRDPDPVVGLAGVREARSLTAKPLVAIGGIDLGNARDVFAAGADSVSMISALSVANLADWMLMER